MKQSLLVGLLLGLTLTAVCGIPTPASASQATNYPWLDDMSLVIVDADDPASFRRAQGILQVYGVRVALLAPPNVVVGWMEPETEREIRQIPEVLDVYTEQVPASKAASFDKTAQRMVNFFNSTVTGDLQAKMAAEKATTKNAPRPTHGDAFTPDDMNPLEVARILKDNGYDTAELQKRGIFDEKSATAKDNTFVMSGTVILSLFMVESDGTGSDPNMYDWTLEEAQDYLNETNAGLAWWSARANDYNCWVAFMVEPFFPDDPNMSQPIEQVINMDTTVPTLVTNVLGNLGFGGSHFSATNAWNVSRRAVWNAERSYSAFVAYSPSPAELPGGAGAFAYIYGPYTFLLSNTQGLESETMAHETGHIFGPCDEYIASNCACNSGCNPNGVENNNCEQCTGTNPCMMKYADFTLCSFTDGHVGWRLASCFPPSLPNPVLTSLNPSSVLAGLTQDITVTGQNFFLGTTIDLGPEVDINNTTFVSDTQVIVNVTVQSPAAPGLLDAVVVNRDLRTGTLVNGFDVLPTPVHYVDPTGGDNYPYLTPADAAPTIADVLTATGPGDEVRLLSTDTLSGINLQVNRSTFFSGGWDSAFNTQDLVNGKTLVDLNVNIWFKEAGGLDGFVLENGNGREEFDPSSIRRGGAVFAQDVDLTITNCEFNNNVAGGQSQDGTGGAVYVRNANVIIEDSAFNSNLSRIGGAIYLENCTGSMARNTFTGNSAENTTGNSIAGGVYLEDCTGLSFEDNDFAGNLANNNGAGMYALNSSGMTMTGGSFTGHVVTADGAGVYLSASALTADGVIFQTNDAGTFGGGLAAASGSSFTGRECQFLQNEAQLGAGLSVVASDGFLEHNLFAGNTCDFTGGAAYLASLTGGNFIGNTVDGNISVNPGGAAVALTSSGVPAYNNIMSNNSDAGFFCAGSPQAALSYNLLFNNPSGGADGCTDVTNSVTGDPLFANAAGGDYHLGVGSAAIDAGNPAGGLEDPDGSPGDIGWYGSHSFVMDQPVFPTGFSATANGANVDLNWNANGEGDLAQYAVFGSASSGFVPSPTNQLSLVAAPGTSTSLPAAGNQFFKISAVDSDGYASGYSTEADAGVVTSAPDGTPTLFALDQNIPNPFNPSTRIQYSVDREAAVQLSIYDATGRRVARLVNAQHEPGNYSVVWNGTADSGARVSSGVYYSKLISGDRVVSRKMVMLK